MNKILSFQSGWVFIFVKTYWASNDINHVGLHFRKALCLYFALGFVLNALEIFIMDYIL